MRLGRHDNNFDLIRFAAAALVLFSHAFPLSGIGPEPILALTGYESGGAIGVATFFVISGYLVAASYLRANDLRQYARNRALRIFPGLIVVVLLAIFGLGPIVTTLPAAEYFSDLTTWRYLGNVVMAINHNLPGVFLDNPFPKAVNGSLWTLPYEMTMYVGIGALGVLGLLGRQLAVAVVAAAGLAVAIAVHYGWLPLPRLLGLADPNQFFKLGYFFFAGSLLYLLGDGLRYRWPVAAALTALWVATFGTPVGWVVYLLAWPYLVIYLAQIPSRWAQRFGRYGDFSYGLYIYAFPIQQLLVWSRPWDNVHLYAAAAFCATLPFAVASWHLVEAPALQLKRRKIRPAVPAPG